MRQTNYPGQERRLYLRLDSVFPVQFRLLSQDEKQILSDWVQGFTSNIGKGGLCLAVNGLNPVIAKSVREGKVKLALRLELPIFKNTVSCLARIIWLNQDLSGPDKYIIGLTYENIDPSQNNKIMRFAWSKKLSLPLTLSIILALAVAFLANSFINYKLIQGNKALVGQLVRIVQESSVAKQKIKQTSREKEDLEIKIQALQLQIKAAEEERQKASLHKWQAMEGQIAQLLKEKSALEQELMAVQHKEDAITDELLRLDKRKTSLERANLDKMYHWLKVHQNPRTGLVLSFEGDGDICDWAFLYDQSLVAQAYTNFGDLNLARKILEFFDKRAKRRDGLFFNAYYCSDGSPAEYTLHAGPNIWLGIAIMQYIKKTGDPRYLKLAEEIAQSIIQLQKQDSEGGIRGGPDTDWYSTEHNLDAYAFFNMLYKITSKAHFREASEKTLDWLANHTYGRHDVPIKRGKGDSTIATDTYAWSLAAVGPQKLEELDMNPDRIIEFAEEHCGVEVSYVRPDGETLSIKGFDFAPRRHSGRGQVVSGEWTAQMVMAFKIMSDFYYKRDMIAKARTYAAKADEYLSQLSNMVISSPSPSGQGDSCIAYATQDSVDTGHGWLTPKGKSTGSLAATAYTLFAYYNYNPLELKD